VTPHPRGSQVTLARPVSLRVIVTLLMRRLRYTEVEPPNSLLALLAQGWSERHLRVAPCL
jgi:hypothetical protein